LHCAGTTGRALAVLRVLVNPCLCEASRALGGYRRSEVTALTAIGKAGLVTADSTQLSHPIIPISPSSVGEPYRFVGVDTTS
jgi:hypothetical protein